MMDDPTDAARSYEAGIFARLEGIKAAYDPGNHFRDLHYVHPNSQILIDGSHGETRTAHPPVAAEAMAPTCDNAISATQAPRPMQTMQV